MEKETEKNFEKEAAVPAEILRDRELAPLEAISEYLKDEKKLTYHEIAALLDRDDRTIWTCYNRAKKKRISKEFEKSNSKNINSKENQKKPDAIKSDTQIPLEILKNRNLAPLESISFFLKNNKGMSFHKIAVLLDRDDRTIWTCCNRAMKKIQQMKESREVNQRK